MNNDDRTTGAPIQINIVYLHPNPSKFIRNGISISPTPRKARRIGGPNFWRFSLEISKKRMIDELKNPLWKKLQAKKAKLRRYSEGEKMVAQQAIPINRSVSSIIELKRINSIQTLQSSLSIFHLFPIIEWACTSANKESGN